MMALLFGLIEVGNFEAMIRTKQFWILAKAIKDPNFQSKFNEAIVKYYACPNCKIRQRRFLDGGFFCINCKNTDQDLNNLKDEDKQKINCLKCFRILNSNSLTGPCYHICQYCASKELAKGNQHCKICRSPYDNNQYVQVCKSCNQNALFKDLFEIRCGCRYCAACLPTIKKQKRCLICEGVNILNSELYCFNTRTLEMCVVCEVNKDLQDFPKKQCCDLDVCRDCQGNSPCPCST